MATRSHKYSNNPIHNPNQAADFRSAHRYSHGGGHVQELHQGRKPCNWHMNTNRFGPPRHPVASLSPPCRCFGTFSPLSLPCRLPVASLSLSCRSPVAPLSLPCRFPTALLSLSCRFLSLPVVSCRHATFCLALSCRSPVALLSFPLVALLSLFPVASLSPSCRLPVVFLPPPCRLPVPRKKALQLAYEHK